MNNLESFGSKKNYGSVIEMVKNDKNAWRKVANLLNKLRQLLSPSPFGIGQLRVNEAEVYLTTAFKDTKIRPEVKNALKRGILMEFGLTI